MGLTSPSLSSAVTQQGVSKGEAEAHFPTYTPSDVAKLKEKYTPQQVEALLAGESAVSPTDLYNQGAIRSDPMMIKYLDDFSTRRDVIDLPARAPEENYDPNLRLKTEDELLDGMTDWAIRLANSPEEPGLKDLVELLDQRITVGKPEAEFNPRSQEAPEIGKLTDQATRSAVKAANSGSTDDPRWLRLFKQTGLSAQQVRRFRAKNLVCHRVVNQTRMGKVQSMYYLNVAGDMKGMVGIGEGKSTEPEDARRQAEINAVRNMVPIRRYEGRTIFGDVEGKVGATELTLMTRPPGFGIRCSYLIYEICKCAGISDLAARVTRARNPMNTVKATMQALLSQRIPEDIARARGKKLVDVRKVYYGGLT